MDDLKLIEKNYGEKMMQLCRNLFPALLDTPGLLYELLTTHFAPTKFLAEDLIANGLTDDFKNYLYNQLPRTNEEEEEEVIKTPFELLSEAGYDLYECKTEHDIQSFRKYYHRGSPTPVYSGGTPVKYAGEELCTFNGGRLDSCYVFFAVKKDVDSIKRKDFKNPKRQDKYGTSVISIQFYRGDINQVSIKNRYNHTVENPDSTFSNDLDNIIAGLEASFEKHYNLNIGLGNKTKSFEIPGYVRANDGKFYKYNYEINNIYYCTDNIIIDNNEVKKDYQDKEKFIIVDYFIFDLQNKKIITYDKNIKDSFLDTVQNIKKIDIKKNKEANTKVINITLEDETNVIIEINKENKIVSYTNEHITEIKDDFLARNKSLTSLGLPNVQKIGHTFLYWNKSLTSLELPNVQKIGDYFLVKNVSLTSLGLPNVQKIGDNFLESNKSLTNIKMPKIQGSGLLQLKAHFRKISSSFKIFMNLSSKIKTYLAKNKEKRKGL